ncbi:nuclear transport factor 2 family protein [Pseudonocardia sp. KRD291]|uniref:nuclear transport factor 2 family protein n=1 Tax=Pseudonocardia sp. KRD291 TaxID=2792007 RepID=UPI001C4A23CA|nr:nuclear transport factor 2 family protein [Pseudonocardia sp. KRD291]MBW0102005.1 nuclear transport factor 2 family protein [Pseudonocardia sp. KRD291]
MDVLPLITRYYDGCSTGDVEAMTATLHPDVVHYFLAPNVGSAPVVGAEHLARYWRKVQARIEARWVVDHALVGGSPGGGSPGGGTSDGGTSDEGEAVIEWTMFWRPPGSDARVATRGAEWFTVEGGLIREIRSYYQQREHTTELDAFDYPGRGYSAPGAEHSSVHRPSG